MKTSFITLLILCAIHIGACCSDEAVTTIDTFEEALFIAKEKKSKILLVFDNYGSPTNYVDKILSDVEIKRAIKNLIVVRLYCDDRGMMNKDQSIGVFNSNIQKGITGEYYQPMFCVLDDAGKLVAPCLGYSKKELVLQYLRKYLK